MSADDILRLHYQERQFLGASDFQDEQAYLIESRRRNNVSGRTWGILSGLEIEESTTGSGLWVVRAGAMIDAYGRETYVGEDTPLDVLEIGNKFSNKTTPVSLKVWLSYATEETSPAAAGYLTCQDKAINTRTRESFRIIYQDDPVPFDSQVTDNPALWPVAMQDLPDDPKEAAWPVYLGTIEWDDQTKIIKLISVTDRRYSGLRGAEVLSQRPQLDIQPARVRLVAAGAEDAVLTTKAGPLHLRTNDDAGGGGIKVDKDDVVLEKKLSVSDTATLESTVGNGSGKLIVEVHATTNIATLTRKNGSGSNHDLAIRTNDGQGGNSILVDKDKLALQSVSVTGAAVLKGGLDSWGPIVLKDPNGGDDSDAMVISRVRTATNKNDLHVQIGDDISGDDRFIVGPVYFGDQAFKEQFIVDNAGNVTAKGSGNIAGTLTTGGNVNGRNVPVDGAKLDTITSGAKQVVVNTGNVPDGGVIPLPFGFTQAQCWWIVGIVPPVQAAGPPPPVEFHSDTDSRVVHSQLTVGLPPFQITYHGSANYLMIGVK